MTKMNKNCLLIPGSTSCVCFPLSCDGGLWLQSGGIVLTVPEGPDALGVALTKEPAPPEETLVVESEDLLPSLCWSFSLGRNKSPG